MKKLFSLTGLIVFLLAFSIIGCKKDKTPEELIIGKWNAVSEAWTDYEDGVKTDEGTDTYDQNEMALEFSDNGTGKVYYDNQVGDTFTWEMNGDVLTVIIPGEDPEEMGFTVNEDDLTLTMTYEETYDGVVYKYVSDLYLTRA